MSASGRLDWVDTGRGIAIVLVTLFHATNWLATPGLDLAVWGDINTVMSSLRLPMFFTLAGLFAAKWIAGAWRDLLRSKVALFLWVLVVWSTIGMIVQLAGLSAAGQRINPLGAARDLVLSPLIPPFELWFLWALGVFFIVAKITRNVAVPVQLTVTAVISAVALTVWLTTTTGVTGSVKFYFFFLLGLHGRRLIERWADCGRGRHALALVGWAAVSVALFAFGLRDVPHLYFANCVVGVFAGVSLSRLVSGATLLRHLGANTLPIYVAHTPVIVLITMALLASPAVVLALAPVAWIVAPIGAAIAITAAWALYRGTRDTWMRLLYEPPRMLLRALGTAR